MKNKINLTMLSKEEKKFLQEVEANSTSKVTYNRKLNSLNENNTSYDEADSMIVYEHEGRTIVIYKQHGTYLTYFEIV